MSNDDYKHRTKLRKSKDVGEAVYKALTGRSPRSEGKTTQQRTRDLLKNCKGDKNKAADMAGVSKETLRRWENGSQDARGDNSEKLQKAQREARLKPRRVKKFAASATGYESGNELGFYATVQISQQVKERWIYPGRTMEPGDLDEISDLIREQGHEAAGERMNDLLSNYVEGMSVTDIHEIRW